MHGHATYDRYNKCLTARGLLQDSKSLWPASQHGNLVKYLKSSNMDKANKRENHSGLSVVFWGLWGRISSKSVHHQSYSPLKKKLQGFSVSCSSLSFLVGIAAADAHARVKKSMRTPKSKLTSSLWRIIWNMTATHTWHARLWTEKAQSVLGFSLGSANLPPRTQLLAEAPSALPDQCPILNKHSQASNYTQYHFERKNLRQSHLWFGFSLFPPKNLQLLGKAFRLSLLHGGSQEISWDPETY